MKLEELIRQQAEEYLKTATRLATESALTGDIWLRHIHQKKEKKKVSTVQIFDADLRFVNEIPMPNTLAGIQYADQLAAEKPGRLYVVMDEHRQKVYQR